jgi:indolepyruvate ferredoxin oxidoreductase
VVQFVPRETLDGVLHHRAKELTNYQNQALAERYKALVGKVQAAEQAINPASTALSLAVARAYFHVLAYKDEYEVARLYTDGDFLRELPASSTVITSCVSTLAPAGSPVAWPRKLPSARGCSRA